MPSLTNQSFSVTAEAATEDIPKFLGSIWYVDGGAGDDANSGTRPGDAFATIGAAISAASAGDAITVKAGTYTETGLDMNLNGLELWPEIGVILDPATGTCLTISGNFCKVWCPGGSMFVTPGANETGIEITGVNAYVSDVRVNCASSADIGFDMQGNGAVLVNCRCAGPLVAAFKIQGDKVKLDNCGTAGESGDSSIGYWVTNACDKVWLLNCDSRGHETSGFQVDTGCTGGVISGCATGKGDGRWIDVDNAFVWANLSYDRVLHKDVTFTAAGGVGGAGTNYNLFKVTATVRVYHIYGIVTTATPATNSTVNLELYSTNGNPDITDSAGAPDLVSRCIGTVLARESVATDPLEIGEPDNTPAVIENTSFQDPRVPVILCEDDAADTYVQLVLSAALASGAMHWHAEWEPVDDDGFLEPA